MLRITDSGRQDKKKLLKLKSSLKGTTVKKPQMSTIKVCHKSTNVNSDIGKTTLAPCGRKGSKGVEPL